MGNGSRAGAWRAALLGEGSGGGGANNSMPASLRVCWWRVGGVAAGSGTSVHLFRKKQQSEGGFFRVYEPCSRPAAKSRIW
jgi:hypothetical protein